MWRGCASMTRDAQEVLRPGGDQDGLVELYPSPRRRRETAGRSLPSRGRGSGWIKHKGAEAISERIKRSGIERSSSGRCVTLSLFYSPAPGDTLPLGGRGYDLRCGRRGQDRRVKTDRLGVRTVDEPQPLRQRKQRGQPKAAGGRRRGPDGGEPSPTSPEAVPTPPAPASIRPRGCCSEPPRGCQE